jgi:hypothetical protein
VQDLKKLIEANEDLELVIEEIEETFPPILAFGVVPLSSQNVAKIGGGALAALFTSVIRVALEDST